MLLFLCRFFVVTLFYLYRTPVVSLYCAPMSSLRYQCSSSRSMREFIYINYIIFCSSGFTAATFRNERIRDSMVTVGIPASDAYSFRSHLDVSLLIRTREPEGFVFYVGTHVNDTSKCSFTLSIL